MSQELMAESNLSKLNLPVALLFVLICSQVALFYSTYVSMVDIWWRSETFAHGFFIFPISFYLIWKKRSLLSTVKFETDLRALIFLLGLGFLWLVSHLIDVIVVQQFAVVIMLPVLVWLVLGFRTLWLFAFPLAYLFFAVPFGDFLIYPMMEFTAIFTVNAVRMVGVPVLWEGLFFTLPSGSWSVVEACSGVRYIIASLTLGCLYAYLTYSSFRKRALFILASIIVPIVANGIRAFMIVMIGHLSSMKLATGVDHLIYGWIWFGIVIFLMFWVGAFWRDEDVDREGSALKMSMPIQTKNLKTSVLATIAGLVLLSVWPIWGSIASQRDSQGYETYALEINGGEWQTSDVDLADWSPRFIKPAYQMKQILTNGSESVGFYLAYYGNQENAGELINSQNIMLPEGDPKWRRPGQAIEQVTVGGLTFSVNETRLNSLQKNLLVWHWDRVNGQYSSNEYYSKVLEAWAQLTGKQKEGFALVFYTTYREDQDLARAIIKQFLIDMLPTIEEQLDKISLR